MIKNTLCNLLNRGKILYSQNNFLFISSLFIPLIAPLFFYADTPLLRNIFYFSIPFLGILIYKCRHDLGQLLSQDRLIWGILCAFLIYMSGSILWSDDGETGRYLSKGKLFFVLGLAVVSTFLISYRYPKFSDVVKNLYIFGATSSAIILLGHYFIKNDFSFGTERMEGMGRASNPVQASLAYGLAVIAITFSSFSEKWTIYKRYTFKAMMILPCAGVILLTQSRGPFLALIVTLWVIFFLRSKNKIKAISLTVIAASVMALIGYSSIQEANIFARKTTGRFEIWETAQQQIMEKPIFGHGIATNKRYTYQDRSDNVRQASHIHSLYLSIVFQGGFIALFMLLSLYYMMARKYWSLIKDRTQDHHLWLGGWMLMGALFGIADFGGIVINVSTEWLVFWWPIGLILGHLARQQQSQIIPQ